MHLFILLHCYPYYSATLLQLYTLALPYTMEQTGHENCGQHVCSLDRTRIDLNFPTITLMEDIVSSSYYIAREMFLPTFSTMFRCDGNSKIVLGRVEQADIVELAQDGTSPFNLYKDIACSLITELVGKKLDNNINVPYSSTFITFAMTLKATENLSEFRSTCNQFIEYLENHGYYN